VLSLCASARRDDQKATGSGVRLWRL
jgi:hypothetical protein